MASRVLDAARLRVAVAAGKATAAIVRRAGRGGTALPGLIAERIAPDVMRGLAARLGHGVILVTGTNGKTTTATMLATILRAAGLNVIHNRTGANLTRGLASTLIDAADGAGGLAHAKSTAGVFEVDEAVLPVAAKALRPRAVIFTNLFRDQLDRYGELDAIASRWRQAIDGIDGATVVVNGDDPQVGALPAPSGGGRLVFGIADPTAASLRSGQTADSIWCPKCGERLRFGTIWYGHLGDYACYGCGYRRPNLDIAAEVSTSRGFSGADLTVRTPTGRVDVHLTIPGVYNVYNALAAVAGALAIGIPAETAAAAIGRFSAAFGRVESFRVGGREVVFLLVKNPTGCDQVLRTVLEDDSVPHLLVALNDRLADGEDVSWIWDVDFEQLAGHVAAVTVTGDRAAELALRFKYAGIEAVTVEPDLDDALHRAIGRGDRRLYVLPTYTAMLDLRSRIAAMTGAPAFWQAP